MANAGIKDYFFAIIVSAWLKSLQTFNYLYILAKKLFYLLLFYDLLTSKPLIKIWIYIQGSMEKACWGWLVRFNGYIPLFHQYIQASICLLCLLSTLLTTYECDFGTPSLHLQLSRRVLAIQALEHIFAGHNEVGLAAWSWYIHRSISTQEY